MADFNGSLERRPELYQLVKYHLKYTFVPHFLLALLLLLITPLIFGVEHLDAISSAIPLELFVSLTGIVLVTPIMAPELRSKTRDLLSVRRVSLLTLWLLRLLCALVVLLALIALFTGAMGLGHCQVSFRHIWGCFISAFFLGALGCLTLSATENIAAAYMIPLLVYCMNMAGGKKLGSFYLFSLTMGEWGSKNWMLLLALGFCAAALGVQWWRRHKS